MKKVLFIVMTLNFIVIIIVTVCVILKGYANNNDIFALLLNALPFISIGLSIKIDNIKQ